MDWSSTVADISVYTDRTLREAIGILKVSTVMLIDKCTIGHMWRVEDVV
jgi:hypothetical protein